MDTLIAGFWFGFGGTLGMVAAVVVTIVTVGWVIPKPKKKWPPKTGA